MFNSILRRRWTDKSDYDLVRLIPKRSRLDFRKAQQVVTDETYERNFNNLFLRIYYLVSETFGDIDIRRGTSPWAREYSDEFYRYVKAVAQQDPRAGNWDRLLRFSNERKYLLQAVIMKILDEEVLSSLLFGSRPDHQHTLEAADASLIKLDGFRRSSFRAHTNKVYLSDSGYPPPLFWQQVDNVAAKTAKLLLPLYNMIGEAAEGDILPLSDFSQRLHNIVADAGLLNVAMRLSPSVFAIDWVKPGDLYEFGQVNLDHGVYLDSETKALQYSLKEGKPKETRCARIKISVAPRITRYSPSQQGSTNGQSVYTMMEPHVVYYHGIRSARKDRATFITLEEHIRLVRRPGGSLPHPVILAMLFFLLFILIILPRLSFIHEVSLRKKVPGPLRNEYAKRPADAVQTPVAEVIGQYFPGV